MKKHIVLLVPLIFAGACHMSPSPPPVPVQGQHEEISAFSGEWTGRYSSKATGRHGTIRFNLPEHADTGYGEVEITFSPALRLVREGAAVDSRAGAPVDPAPEPCTAIGITVIRIEDDSVRGTMTPYWDPDCECRAHTVFEGKRKENSITGTFSTRLESNERPVVTGDVASRKEDTMIMRSVRARRSETQRSLPGDELLANARSLTHAITIQRPRSEIWPWLVQMGAGRAGWYSYDQVDNGGTTQPGSD